MQFEIKFKTQNGAQLKALGIARLSSKHQDQKSLVDQAKCVLDILFKKMSDGSTGSRKGATDVT